MQETISKFKTNKTISTTKSKKSFFTQINSFLIDISNIFIWIINQLNSALSKFSILNHFIIILVPVSLAFIILIFYIHLKFYDKLFRFNYYKAAKEEFMDYYITEIDDMNSELETFLVQESYLDIENILFFEIYFNELISIGLLDNSSEKIFPDIHYESDIIYKDIDIFYEICFMTNQYSVKEDEAKIYIDNRNDSLKELAKIYFYMLPVINYGVFFSGVIIDQSFLIAYEFDDERNLKEKELYFTFPRSNFTEIKGENFKIKNGYINPLIHQTHFHHSEYINGNYYKENFFKEQDWDFRNNVNLSEESWFDISFGHINYENNGNITKKIIATLQLNVNRNGNRHFIINLLLFLDQFDIFDEKNEFTILIAKNNSQTYNWLNSKYSDNETFVISQQEFTEYSLSTVDNKFFHYGLFDKNYNFMENGVSYDSFNLNLFSEPIKYFKTIDDFTFDLKYLSMLFLYSKLFQNIKDTKYKKEGEEISLITFNDEEKVKKICNQLNLSKYIEYIKSEKEINCWDSQNLLYYSEDDYKEAALFDTYTSIPNCACLPLYCLNNYKNLKNNKYKFNDDNIVSSVNLPDKCQNNFDYYLNKNLPEFTESYGEFISGFIFFLFNANAKTPEKDYIKIKKEELLQLPGYYLLVFTQIKSNAFSFFYLFYNPFNKIEIIIIIIIVLIINFAITIVIIYINLRKFSLIIEEYSQKYERFVYHSVCSDINVISHEERRNTNNQTNNNIDKMNNRPNMNEEYFPFLENDDSLINEVYNNENTLIEELFSIYCKYYKICRKKLEKYYSKKMHETKFQMKLKMMTEKNELFKLLCIFSIYAPFFRLNLSLEYNMYKYSKIIKKYDQYLEQIGNYDKEKAKLTKNILYELLSTENLSDYGLIMNLDFKYISNINAENNENSIKNALFRNVIYKMKGKSENNEEDLNINDIFFIIKDGDESQNIKLVLKKKNELIDLFKNQFESDDFLNFNKIESSFNFFLINSYYKYLRQISLEE